MASTFGGFSANGDISTFLQSQKSAYVTMVVSHSALLKAFSNQQDEVIRVAQRQVYPRIGLILAAAKNLDNTYLFTDASRPSGSADYLIGVYETVVGVMTSQNSPFSEGLTSIAAMMTAAVLIRQIPINSDIKNLDLAAELEKMAATDLNRIVDLYKDSKAVASVPVDSTAVIAGSSIFVSLGIDKSTLPASYFDVDPPEEAIDIKTAYPSAQIRPLTSLSIPSSKVAFGWAYVSSTELDNGSNVAPTVSTPIEQAFFINNGMTSDDIIELIAEELNDLALSASSNIVCSPNRGQLTVKSTSLIKKKLYPEISSTYDRKLANFEFLQQINSLTFDVRRVSSLVHRELIVLRFFSVDKTVLAQAIAPTLTPTYGGAWDNSTTYSAGTIVDIGKACYICLVTNTNSQPTTSNTNWQKLYTAASDLAVRKGICDGYIDGLVYGLSSNFSNLEAKGPKSLVLNVDKGTIKSLSASSNSSSTNNSDEINTVYFQGTPTSGQLKIRLSSTDFSDFPDLAGVVGTDGSLTIPITGITSAEDLALAVLKTVYTVSQATDVLAALVQPNALQFSAFKKTEGEVREVIDLLEIPEGIEVATGTSFKEAGLYKPRPRSLVITATPIKDNLVNSGSTTRIDNKEYGVAKAISPGRSQRLQSVVDKLNFLKDL